MARQRSFTPEEKRRYAEAKRAELAGIHQRLQEGIAALATDADWRRWLRFATMFRGYSFRNVLLILSQRPDATRVAGLKAWNELGRHVRKGEHGIAILAPTQRRVSGGPTDHPDDDTSDPAGAAAESDKAAAESDPAAAAPHRVLTGFRLVRVFDVAQTAGDPLPAVPDFGANVQDAPPDGLWLALVDLTRQQGYTLVRSPAGDAEDGYTNYQNSTVAIRDGLPDGHAVYTQLHELGHVLLHGPDLLAAPTTRRCQGTVEVEAESVAYLVATRFGLDTAQAAFPYIATWAARAGAADPVKAVTAAADRALAAAAQILDHVESQLGLAKPPPAQLATRVQAGQARTDALAQAAAAAARPHDPSAAPPGGAPATLFRASPAAADETPARLVAANEAAAEFYRAQLRGAVRARTYLTGRGLAGVVDRDRPWRVGYAPPAWTALTDHLRRTGFTGEEVLAAGLAVRTRDGHLIDLFRDRIMLPVRDRTGATVGFIGRPPAERPEPDVPKYLNTPATTIYDKGQVLFGLAEQRDRLAAGWRPALVEGPLDTIGVWLSYARAGRPGTVALSPCGTALTSEHVSSLARLGLPGSGIVVAFDADAAGARATDRAWQTLRPLRPQSPLYAVALPPGADPASLAATPAGRAQLRYLFAGRARPLVDAVIDSRLAKYADRLHTPEGRVAAVRAAAGLVADVPAEAARLAEYLATSTGASIEAVTGALIEALESPVHPWARADRGRQAAFPRPVRPGGTHAPAAGGPASSYAGPPYTRVPRPGRTGRTAC